jgi:hypothetical protein
VAGIINATSLLDDHVRRGLFNSDRNPLFRDVTGTVLEEGIPLRQKVPIRQKPAQVGASLSRRSFRPLIHQIEPVGEIWSIRINSDKAGLFRTQPDGNAMKQMKVHRASPVESDSCRVIIVDSAECSLKLKQL